MDVPNESSKSEKLSVECLTIGSKGELPPLKENCRTELSKEEIEKLSRIGGGEWPKLGGFGFTSDSAPEGLPQKTPDRAVKPEGRGR